LNKKREKTGENANKIRANKDVEESMLGVEYREGL